MNHTLTLFKPRIWSIRNPLILKPKKGRTLKMCLFGFIGLCVWGGIFVASLRILHYFKSIHELGELIGLKLLSMILITVFSLMIFSSIITCLSKLYLSKDLSLVHSMPVASFKIFFTRWVESTFDSSWMVLIYALPMMLAYGIVYGAGIPFYLMIPLSLIPLSFIASGISAFMVMLGVVIIPANRLRSIFVFLGLALFLVLYLAFRLMRPERLVDPEVFATALIYLKALRSPAPPYLPSTWAFDSLRLCLLNQTGAGFFHLAMAWSFASFLGLLNILFADAVYFRGISKSQTAPARFIRNKPLNYRGFGFLSGTVRAFVIKEIKSFYRDQTQWSQLFLIAALFFIYIYNFKVLPLEKAPIKTIYLQNLLSFLNLGLAAFVLTAVTVRFAFPAVSIEGEAFWLVQSAPITYKNYLWIKFFIYYLPLLLLSESIIVVTNLLLNVTPFMMILSTITIFFLVPGIVAMGIGLGAAFPDFRSENPTQSATGFGGLLFMILCVGFVGLVIILEAGPVYQLFMADMNNRDLTMLNWIWTIGSFALVFILCVFAVIIPMKYGEKQLSQMEA